MNQEANLQGLTNKQQTFVEEYLIDLNATQAAIRAGYSKDTAKEIGCENLTKPNVAKAIQEAMKERSERTQITAEWVLEQLKENHGIARENGKISDSNKSLELLGKHLKLFMDKVDTTGSIEALVPTINMVIAKSENINDGE